MAQKRKQDLILPQFKNPVLKNEHGIFLSYFFEHIGKIGDAHRKALEVGITNSVASCTLMIELGEQVYFSAGSEKNIKLTTIEDIDIFKALLMAKRSAWLKE